MLEQMLKHRELAHATRGEAARRLAEAQAALAKAQQDDSWAEGQARASDKAIHDLLKERGMHFIVEPDGTASTYHATDGEPGWVKDHPIPGSARMLSKATPADDQADDE